MQEFFKCKKSMFTLWKYLKTSSQLKTFTKVKNYSIYAKNTNLKVFICIISCVHRKRLNGYTLNSWQALHVVKNWAGGHVLG